MATLVAGIAASHTTLMNTRWEEVEHLERAHAFRNALHEAAEHLKACEPELVVVVGSNHFRGYWLDLMPAFSMGVGAVIAAGEHGTPRGEQRTDPESARAICAHLIEGGFDVAFSTRQQVDHGVSHAIQWLVGENTIPVIPLVVNCFAPPLPTFDRCLALGRALAESIGKIQEPRRVAIIASGGLSHQLPFPDWRRPESEDDRFLVDSWENGRDAWDKYEQRRRSIVTSAPASINEDFDRRVLGMVEQGNLHQLGEILDEEEVVRVAGNGANELRTWLVLAAAMAHRPGRSLCYSPMPEWLTGMGVAVL